MDKKKKLNIEEIEQMLDRKLTVAEVYANRPHKWIVYTAIVLIIVTLVGWSAADIKFTGLTATGTEVAKGVLHGVFHPDTNLMFGTTNTDVPYLLLQTMAIAVLGTLFGAILAIPFAFLASFNIMPKPVAYVVRVLILMIRTIPSIVWALMWIRVTGPGAACGSKSRAGGRVGHRVSLACQRERSCALVLGRELRVYALGTEVVGLALRQDGNALHIARAVKGPACLYVALEALLGTHHIIGVLVQLVHRVDAIGSGVGICQGQKGACHRGAGTHQPMQTQRHCQCGRAHGGIARQPSAPQRLRRMICLLHCFTCLFLSSCTESFHARKTAAQPAATVPNGIFVIRITSSA